MEEKDQSAPALVAGFIKAVFPVNAVKASLNFDIAEVEALLADTTMDIDDKIAALENIEAPMLLVRWPRGLKLPETISDELKRLGITGVPSVSVQSPVDGAAMLGLIDLEARRSEGPVGIEIEFDEMHVRLTAKGNYITLSPNSVNLDKYFEIKPVFTSDKTADDDTKLRARLLNKINSLRIAARTQAANVTPSGSVIPGSDPNVPTGDAPF